MDQVLQYNFGYLPPKSGLTSDLPLSYLASKRSSLFGVSAADRARQAKKQKANGHDAVAVLEQRCIDLVRVLAADMVQQANSGHPGAAMGCAPIAHQLWAKVGPPVFSLQCRVPQPRRRSTGAPRRPPAA